MKIFAIAGAALFAASSVAWVATSSPAQAACGPVCQQKCRDSAKYGVDYDTCVSVWSIRNLNPARARAAERKWNKYVKTNSAKYKK